MNINLIKSEFEKAGWKQVQPGNHLDIDFDLVGYRRFTFTKWNILVKVLPLLDQTTADVWKANFEAISKKSKSLIWGRCFLLCLLAEDVSIPLEESFSPPHFGWLGVVRVKGGGGNLLIADIKSKQVYVKVPLLPLDVHNYSKSAKKIIFVGVRNMQHKKRGN